MGTHQSCSRSSRRAPYSSWVRRLGLDHAGVGIDDGSAAGWTRLSAVAGEQMLQDGIDAFVFLAIEFRVLVKRYVARAANVFHLATNMDRLALQSLKFFTHGDLTGR
jgi:hypothetical protein